jgi:uncharacterized protein with HEPN domain
MTVLPHSTTYRRWRSPRSGFRNRLAHGYLNVNVNIVWNVIENDLPPLKQAAEAMLQSLGAAEED